MTSHPLHSPARHLARALIGIAVFATAATAGRAQSTIPSRLSDKDLWQLNADFSEPNGYFRSDNFLSNERGYQAVIPSLVKAAKAGRIYLGVGPEQNYPYILALKPALAIIFDVRRGNLHEQLLYKAIFEMSSDRVDFLSRLFSRPKPDTMPCRPSANAVGASLLSHTASG